MSTYFDEQAYLRANPDVAAAVARGEFKSGADHYNLYGQYERRAGDGSNSGAQIHFWDSPAWQAANVPEQNKALSTTPKTAGWGQGFDQWFQKFQYWDDPVYRQQLEKTLSDPSSKVLAQVRNPTGVAIGEQRSDGAVWDGMRWTDPLNYNITLDHTGSLEHQRNAANLLRLHSVLSNTTAMYANGVDGAGIVAATDPQRQGFMVGQSPLWTGGAYFAYDGSIATPGSGLAATNNLHAVGKGGGMAGGPAQVNPSDMLRDDPSWVPNRGLSANGSGAPFSFEWGPNGTMRIAGGGLLGSATGVGAIGGGGSSGGSGSGASSGSGLSVGGGTPAGGSGSASSGLSSSIGYGSSITTPNQPLPNTALIEGRLSTLLATDQHGNYTHPLVRQAAERAMQAFAGRGLLNSSMAIQAAQEAAIAKAIDIAGPDAQRVFDNLRGDKDWAYRFQQDRLNNAAEIEKARILANLDLDKLRAEYGYRADADSISQAFNLRQNYVNSIANITNNYQQMVNNINQSGMRPEDKQAALADAAATRDAEVAYVNDLYSKMPGWQRAWLSPAVPTQGVDINTITNVRTLRNIIADPAQPQAIRDAAQARLNQMLQQQAAQQPSGGLLNTTPEPNYA